MRIRTPLGFWAIASPERLATAAATIISFRETRNLFMSEYQLSFSVIDRFQLFDISFDRIAELNNDFKVASRSRGQDGVNHVG